MGDGDVGKRMGGEGAPNQQAGRWRAGVPGVRTAVAAGRRPPPPWRGEGLRRKMGAREGVQRACVLR
jgi:hypothetical protein